MPRSPEREKNFRNVLSRRETASILQLKIKVFKGERKEGNARETADLLRELRGDCTIQLRQGVSVSPSFLARINRHAGSNSETSLAVSDLTARTKVTEVSRGNSRCRALAKIADLRFSGERA